MKRAMVGSLGATCAAWLALTALGGACTNYYVDDDAGLDGASAGDGPLTDAVLSADGATEAGSPCAAQGAGVLLCDDFDHGALGDGWQASDPLFAELDTSTFVSSPRSMRVAPPDVAHEYTSYVRRTFGDVARFRFATRMRVQQGTGGVATVVFGFFCGSSYELSFNLDGARVVEQGGGVSYVDHATSATFPIDAWQLVEMDVKRDTGTVAMRVAGAEVLAETKLAATATGGSCDVAVGLFYAGAHASAILNFDDVVVSTLQ